MTVLPGVDFYGVLNSVPLDTYAWRVVEGGYDELLNCPALRGADLVMFGSQGRRGYPRIIDATVISIPLLVSGEFDEDGTPIANKREGLYEHRDYLRANLGLAADSDPDRGTVPFVFNRGSLADWTGDVTFLGFNGWTSIGRHDAMVRIDLSIPDGELAEAGS